SAPSNDIVDFEILDKLDDNCTLIRKYPETFLCLVGLSRSFANLDARPTLLCRDKSDMGLLDFVKYSDPFKVRTEERTLASSEVPLLTETADMVVNSCAQSIRLVTHTITNEINTHAGKNKRKVGFSNATPPVKKVRTGEGVRVNEHVTTAGNLFLSFRSSLLRVVRPVLILGVSLPMLRNLCLLLLLLPWNVVPHVPSVHADAEIMTTGPANETHDSSMAIQQKDVAIVDLRYRLEKAKGEAAEITVLRGHVFGLEVAAIAKAEELANLLFIM
nr:transposase (putative), gypsy type [Tanacetum cinerariifolium]